MLSFLLLTASLLWGRLKELREDDRGMTTETVIITAALAGVALLVVGWLVTAIRDKGGEIQTDINTDTGGGG
jgi:hypothetical protein